MSVQQSTIIIVGIKFDYKEFKNKATESLGEDYYDKLVHPFDYSNFESKHEKNMEGLKCIFDGMSGRYVIYGHPLAIAYESEGLNGIYSFDQDDLESYKKDVLIDLYKNKIQDVIPFEEDEVTVHVLTHFS
jgi:hypothetical protein